MASANGVLSPLLQPEPPASPLTQSAKRKRDDVSEIHTNGIANTNSESADHIVAQSKSLIRDLIDVLKEFDTTPSVLDRPISDRPSSAGPEAKRQKAESTDTQRSILTRFSGDVYKNIDEVLEDIDSAVSDMMDTLRLPNGTAQLSGHQSAMSMKITAFKQRAHELIKSEKFIQEKKLNTGVNAASSTNYNLNGGHAVTQINPASSDKMVLTLYGSAPGPKQLFSSLQIPPKSTGEQKDILQTLREVGLPNGITATRIVQSTGLPSDDKKRVPTLGELFPTPANVPSLLPPKPSKIATTRSLTVGWYQPSASDSLPRSASYSKQSISCGHWLDYSNVSASSQGTKRKRDRALSLVGAKTPTELEPVESEVAKLDALFRSAYSGFAPTKDDAAAVAPARVLGRMWWQQVGEKNFEKMVESATDDVATDELNSTSNEVTDTSIKLEEIEKMIEELENDGIDPTLVPLEAAPEKSVEERDAEEILEGISELLETLNSYQRIRHMSLNPSSRPAGLLSAPDTSSQGTPTKPSESEQATYEILKSQLTLMIATLPPYAVAKLDPDRLAELSISTKIEVPMNDYKGVMEEDEAVARAKVASMTATSSTARAAPATTSSHRTSSASLYGNQYAPSRSAQAPASQYYGAQTPIRPPSTNYQRPPATAPVAYQPQRAAVPASAPYRPGPAYGTPTYPHQNPRPVQQAYAPASQQYQTPSNQAYMQPPRQSYQHVPQAVQSGQLNGRYPSQPAYANQTPTTQQNAMQYGYNNGVNVPRQVSPQKPIYSPQPTLTQPRPSYSTPTPPMPQARPYMQPQIAQPSVMNGAAAQAPPSQYTPNSSNLTSGYQTFMTQEQQSSMMERQRSLLAAQQQQTQQNARNAAMGNASGGQVNGNSAVAAGL
ncbi:related to tpa inducible protein [Phialocephala subalpina]|uniref:Related to tpa inducible protein n=1 Tax=Phialocephala subalpina TaxID=576137 RepID=A0A1L7XGQ7_9HELO|nr:related to tpa inducible protein [Phialocephala subalpina]